MPPDEYYGSSGANLLHSSQMRRNSNYFLEPESNTTSFIQLRPQECESPYSAPGVPPAMQISPLPGHVMPFSRSKSSSSAFPRNVDDQLFPVNPYRIKNKQYAPQVSCIPPQSMPSIKAVSPSYYPGDYTVSNPSASPTGHAPIPIAPNPVRLRQIKALKRMRDEEEYSGYCSKNQNRASSQSDSVELNEEERLLLKLKEEENLPWKDISTRFQTDLGKSYQVPALQMRFKRLRERMRTWTETDVQALEQAYDYWEKFQFDIIAAKMLELGAEEQWPAKHCARKWEKMHPDRVPFQTHSKFLRTASPVKSISHSHSPRPP